MGSFFDRVQQAPADLNFGLAETFAADARSQKIDLVLGVYKDEQLKCDLLPSVKRAKEEILNEDGAVYLPIDGSRKFCDEIGKLLFGDVLWGEESKRIASAQAVGGTGALSVLGFLAARDLVKSLYIPTPTWVNHRAIFERAGLAVGEYIHYVNKAFDFEGVSSFLKKAPEGSAILFHAVCHNPTGCDPTLEEWKELARLMRERRLLPFFDCAYQGFGDDLEKDVEPMRQFLQEGLEFVVAYSCSKNFSLYCQRVGALFVVSRSAAEKVRIESQVKKIIRAIYSNPPAHGARVAAHILGGSLRKSWEEEVAAMRGRLQKVRHSLVEKLGPEFHYLLKQKGMFSLLDLKSEQLQRLMKHDAIYMASPGRLSMAGINQDNIDRIVQGISGVR